MRQRAGRALAKQRDRALAEQRLRALAPHCDRAWIRPRAARASMRQRAGRALAEQRDRALAKQRRRALAPHCDRAPARLRRELCAPRRREPLASRRRGPRAGRHTAVPAIHRPQARMAIPRALVQSWRCRSAHTSPGRFAECPKASACSSPHGHQLSLKPESGPRSVECVCLQSAQHMPVISTWPLRTLSGCCAVMRRPPGR